MNAVNQKIVSRLLRKAADDIDKNKCGMDDEELMSVSAMFIHRKMYIEQVAEYIGVSSRTLERMVLKGELPEWKKEPSGKKYMWLDDIERFRKDNK